MRKQKRDRKIKQLYQRVIALIWVLVLILTVMLCALIGKRERGRPKREDFKPVVRTIQAGDTAWRIADEYCPETLDKREYLVWCEQLNGGDIGYIKAGEQVIFLECVR